MSYPQATHPHERWILWVLAGIQFSHIVDFMIMMPLGPQITRQFDIGDAAFGFLVSAYTWAAAISGLVASAYVDRFDRKRLLLVLFVAFAIATLGCAVAWSYASLVAARIATGLFGGVLSALVQTMVAELIPFERRGRAMSIILSAFSLATVVGVPSSLFIAAWSSWHMPFVAIAVMGLLLSVLAWRVLPRMRGHLQSHDRPAVLAMLTSVLADVNHRWAFLFSALMMFTGFAVIPYITIYLQTNVGLNKQEVPLIYLFGGAATLFTARWIGKLSDRHGKVFMFSALAALVVLPLQVLTHLGAVALPWVIGLNTVMFVVLSGRMIPGMALVGASANPEVRGSFMAINSAVQSLSMGAAAFVGGLIISRDAQGMVQNYGWNAMVGSVASLLSIWVVRRLVVRGTGPIINQPSPPKP
ncbi:MAG: MFS transporter [Betaproteobacteria bacterium]|nr:MFS transporter [Betaproteobacteria bacterium]